LGLLIFLSLITVPTFAENNVCDRRDAVAGWGIWCGAEDFVERITESDPPGAGESATGAPSGDTQVATPDITDTDAFGGKPDLSPDEPEDLPIALPEGDTVYYRAAYAQQVEGPPAQETVSPQGIGTMELELSDGQRQGGDDLIAGRDLDADGAPVAEFRFDKDSGDSRYVQVDAPQDLQQSGAFTAGFRSRSDTRNDAGRRASTETRVGLISGREETSAGQGAASVLKDYWSGARSETLVNVQYLPDREYENSRVTNSFVGGQLTPLADIQALAGETAAVYRGVSQQLQQQVEVTVNFSAQSFSGRWTGGQLPGASGGDPSFNASGVIQGQHIVATSFSDGVNGDLQGSFFRPQAKALGGAYDLQKSGVGRFNDTFTTTRP
jgi:hypothetical protein